MVALSLFATCKPNIVMTLSTCWHPAAQWGEHLCSHVVILLSVVAHNKLEMAWYIHHNLVISWSHNTKPIWSEIIVKILLWIFFSQKKIFTVILWLALSTTTGFLLTKLAFDGTKFSAFSLLQKGKLHKSYWSAGKPLLFLTWSVAYC